MKKRVSLFWVKILLVVVFLLALTGMAGLFAIDIHLEPPKLGGSNPYLNEIQGEVNRAFAAQKALYQSELQGINDNPQKLIGAFATSSIFSSTGASQRTYQGYDTFALTLGAMGGVQIPGKPLSWVFGFGEELDNVYDAFDRNGDIQAGLNPQILNAQVGFNTSRFLLKGLYVGAKGGFLNLNLPIDDYTFSFQTWSIGGLVNYQIFPRVRLVGGMLTWRGLNIGTGFIYQRTSLTLGVPMFAEDGDLEFPIYGSIMGKISNAKFEMGFNVNTFTMPLEAVTSICLLGFVNVSLGGGVDFGFGSAALEGAIDASINVSGFPGNSNLYEEEPGRFSVTMGGINSPSLVNPKVMASFGLNAGPAIILDIPITWYFQNNGYNVGITFGIAL